MSRQKHRIMRQVLEIRGCPSAEAWRVQNEIRRIYYQRVVPLMETAFAGVSSPDRILRISTLEIDLGEVPLGALEHALCSEFENVFARELAAAISQAQKAFGSVEDVTLASQLELFSYYLKTGAVPWWADLARRNLLEDNLEFLIQQAPVALAQAMQELGNQERALRRIVLSYPDHLLDGLSCVLAPGLWAAFPGFTRELVALLQTAASVSKSRSPSLGRTVLWEETLRLANTRDVSALEPFSFFRGIFMRLAHRSGVAYRSLISDIDEGLKAGSSKVHPRAAAIVQSLYREICPATAESGPEAESMHAELVELLERFDGSGPSTADLRVRLRAILDRLPPSSLAQALAKLKLWPSRAAGSETLTSELIAELAGPGPLSAPTPSLSPASTPASVDHQLRLKTGFSKAHPRAAAIVQSLYREICYATAEFGPEAESIHGELVELLERFDGSGPSTADLRVHLRAILDRLAPSSLAQALAKLKLWLSRAAGSETLTSELIAELAGPGPLSAPTPSLSPASMPASVDRQLRLNTGFSQAHPRAAAIVQSLYREICSATAEFGPEAESIHAELVELLERFDGSGPSTADLRVRLRAILDRLPPSSLAQALAKLKLWLSHAAGGETLTSELIAELAGPGPLSAPTPSLSPASTPASVDHQLESPIQEICQPGSEGGAEIVPRPEPYPAKRTPPTPPKAVESWKKPIDLSFSDSDELYVNNSGLVILWPFLVRFFERLGLLEERRFKDVAATHRAVRLLQHLADPHQEPPPEYLLVLNKVLCGMPVDEVFDFGLPLTEHEIEECHSLLTAVIEQAPVLHNMSVAGFRATFLLRRGQLSTRDGAWLLRVERETYDLVLDRFPWGIAWVKLPWMEDPMQVEW